MHTSLVKYKLLAIRLATLVAMLLLVPHIQSQTVYPLRTFATINGTTPYTLDGFVSQDGKLQVQIITDDVTIEHYAVKLRLTLQSSSVRIVTSAAYRPQPIYLEGGTQEILTSIDLADLFNPNNLTFEGITKAQYNSTGRLPEGVYRISVDVLDYYRNVVVSRSTPAIGMMYLTKAPLLTFPANGAEIDIATSPQIRFSWMTYHPINPAAEVVHRFRLWEVKPAGRNPYEVINVLKPIYEEEVTTGAALLLSPDLPLLNQGSTYVWQIQGVDLQNQVIYQNSGKSEAYTFRYGKSCVMPVPRIVSINTSGAQIAWNGNITTQQYRVNWKQSDDAEWHTDVTTLTTYGLKELIDNTDYQITVQAICGSEESETSAPIKFRTNRNVNYTCGTGNGQFDISNTEPLPTLSRFDEFKAADFIIEANEVTGSNGSFSGTGYALVPYLSFLKMMVTFDNITINTDRRMIKGQIEFVYDETTGMVLSLFKSDPKKQSEVASEFLAKGVTQVVTTTKEVSSVSVNDKTVTISLADGSTQQVSVDKKGDTVGVISPDGKTAYVADTGSGMVFTTPVPGTGEAANSSGVATPSQTGKYGCSVVVSPAKTQRYGFDAVGNGKIKPNNYFLNSKSGDAVAWKSIPAGGTDFVDVTVTGNCSPDSLRFLRENDMPVPSAPSGTARQLLLTGTAEGDEEVLTIALSSKQLQKDSTYRQTLTEAGALGLVTYTPIVRDVIMVPVNKATAPTGSGAIKTTLDKLFAPALVTWNVTIASAITVADITEEGFKTTGLSLASRYTSDMNKVIKAYKETHKISKNTLVLFFVTSPNSDKMGYMPLTGDYGFIFNLSSNVELLAHELSHGAFNLRHTFSDDAYWRGNGKAPVFPEKSTQNLMDYANGTELWKYQWDLIHDPEGILFGALDEEEGAYKAWAFLNGDVISNIPSHEKEVKSFVTLTGEIITLPVNSKDYTFYKGYLASFTIGEERYVAMHKSNIFSGFFYDAKQIASDSYDASKSNAYLGLAIDKNIKPDVYYVLKNETSTSCGVFNIKKGVYKPDLPSIVDGGIGKSTEFYKKDIEGSDSPLSGFEQITAKKESINCLQGRAKELYKFIITHYEVNGYPLTEAQKEELSSQLALFQVVQIQGIDADYDKTAKISKTIQIREMLNYGAIEFIAKLNLLTTELYEKNPVDSKALLVEFEDFERLKDIHLIYCLVEKTGATCDIADKLHEEIKKQLSETGTVELNLSFVIALAKSQYEIISGHQALSILNCLLKTIKATEAVYNPNRMDYELQGVYELLFKYVFDSETLAGNLPVDVSQYTWACDCGIYNSILDLVLGLTELAENSTQNPVDFVKDAKAFYDRFSVNKAMFQGIWELLKQHHGYVEGYGFDSYQATYGTCYDVTAILSLFIGVGEIEAINAASKAGDLSEVARIVVNAAKNYPKNTILAFKDLTKAVAEVGTLATQKVILKAIEVVPTKLLAKLPSNAKGVILATALNDVVRFTELGKVDILVSIGYGIDHTKNIIYTSAETVTDINGKTGRLVIGIGEDGKGWALIEDLAETGSKLVDNLTGALKSTYDDLLTKGFHAVEEAGKIKFLDNTGRHLAEISNGKLILKYAGFGGDVVITEGRATTVLGKFTEPNNTAIGTRYFLGSNSTPVVQGFPNGSINRGVGSAIPNRLNFLDLPETQYNALINYNIKAELETVLGSSSNINIASQSIPDVKNLIKASHPELTTTQIDYLVSNGITKGNKEFWTNYNLPFLEQAFQRGDDIRLVSDPDFYKNATDVIGGTYKKELLAIDQLKGQYGYSYNSTTKTYYKY